jgi:hypothetical protein
MSGPGCGACAHRLIHRSFTGFGKTQSPRLPCGGNVHESQPSFENVLGRVDVAIMA